MNKMSSVDSLFSLVEGYLNDIYELPRNKPGDPVLWTKVQRAAEKICQFSLSNFSATELEKLVFAFSLVEKRLEYLFSGENCNCFSFCNCVAKKAAEAAKNQLFMMIPNSPIERRAFISQTMGKIISNKEQDVLLTGICVGFAVSIIANSAFPIKKLWFSARYIQAACKFNRTYKILAIGRALLESAGEYPIFLSKADQLFNQEINTHKLGCLALDVASADFSQIKEECLREEGFKEELEKILKLLNLISFDFQEIPPLILQRLGLEAEPPILKGISMGELSSRLKELPCSTGDCVLGLSGHALYISFDKRLFCDSNDWDINYEPRLRQGFKTIEEMVDSLQSIIDYRGYGKGKTFCLTPFRKYRAENQKDKR